MSTIKLANNVLSFLFQDNRNYSLSLDDFQSLVKTDSGYTLTFKDPAAAVVVPPVEVVVTPAPTPVSTLTNISSLPKTLLGLDTKINFDWNANKIAKGASVVEPTSKASIKRLTDVKIEKPGVSALYNGYSRFSVENITGEYFIAFASNSTSSIVYSTKTLAPIKYLEKGCYHEIRWHGKKDFPNRIYYVSGTKFYCIDDVTNTASAPRLIKDFDPVIDWAGLPNNSRQIYMDQEGNSSLDSDHWAWMATYYDSTVGQFKVRAYVHYQVSTNKVDLMYPKDLAAVSRVPVGESSLLTFSARPNMVEMAPDGSGIVLHHARAYPGWYDKLVGTIFEAPSFWPVDFKESTFKPFRLGPDATHSGWSTIGGKWYFIQQDNRRDKLCAVPISGDLKGYGNEGKIDVTSALGKGVIDFMNDSTPYPGMHFGICRGRSDGYTLLSTYSTETASQLGRGNALFLIELTSNPSGIKWHIAPTCNQWDSVNKQDYNEATASFNMDCSKIYVAGNWNGFSEVISGKTERYTDLYSISV
jgi:hypothetical protein